MSRFLSLFSRDKDKDVKNTTDAKDNRSENVNTNEENAASQKSTKVGERKEDEMKAGRKNGVFKRFSFSSAETSNQAKNSQDDR